MVVWWSLSRLPPFPPFNTQLASALLETRRSLYVRAKRSRSCNHGRQCLIHGSKSMTWVATVLGGLAQPNRRTSRRSRRSFSRHGKGREAGRVAVSETHELEPAHLPDPSETFSDIWIHSINVGDCWMPIAVDGEGPKKQQHAHERTKERRKNAKARHSTQTPFSPSY